MLPPADLERRKRAALRMALSHYLSNGLSAALGLLLISGSVHLLLGAFAAAAASVGVVVCIPPDQPAPKRGKFFQLLPAAVLGLPLFFAVQVLHTSPVSLGLLLVPASFLAFLAAAWGRRGLPIAVSVMFAMVFSMAVPDHTNSATTLSTSLYFALGAGLYVVWATLANAALNARYRVQMLADTLLSLVDLMRTQAQQFDPAAMPDQRGQAPLIGKLLKQQAALADQLQTARDILLESPRTPRRRQLAGMLLHVLEMRDHLLVCELDLDTLKSHAGHAPALSALREVVEALADEIERLADALLLGRGTGAFESYRSRLTSLQWADDAPPATPESGPSPAMLALGLANRVGHLNDETLRLIEEELIERGLMSFLRGGVVLCGGGARIPGLAKVTESIFQVPTSLGQATGLSGATSALEQPEFATGLGLVRFGAMQARKKRAGGFFDGDRWQRLLLGKMNQILKRD